MLCITLVKYQRLFFLGDVMETRLRVHYNYFIDKIIYQLLIMQNSLKRDLKSNLDNFNLNFKKKLDSEYQKVNEKMMILIKVMMKFFKKNKCDGYIFR